MTADPRDPAERPEGGLPKPEHVNWMRWLAGRLHHVRPFHLSLRILAVPVIAVLALLAYLSTIGMPPPLTRKLLERVRESGYFVEVRRLRFDLLDGITADQVRFYGHEDAVTPVLEADRVTLDFDPLDWLSGEAGLKGMSVRNGELHLAAGQGSGRPREARGPVLEKAWANLRIEPGGTRVTDLRADFLGIRVEGRGFIVRRTTPAAGPRTGADRILEILSTSGEPWPPWMSAFLEELQGIRFTRPPTATIAFTVHPEHPRLTELEVVAAGGQTRSRGVLFDGWRFEGRVAAGQLSIPSLVATSGRHYLRFSGSVDSEQQVVEAKVFSSLPATHWASLIPIAWRERWEESGVVLTGPASCELVFEPAPLKEFGRHITGWVSLEQADLKGIRVENASAVFGRRDQAVTIGRVNAVVGRDRGQGPLSGWMKYDMDSQAFEGHLDSNFDPNELLSILTVPQQRVVRPMRFEEVPPEVSLDFSGALGVPEAFAWTGQLRATNFFYNGAFINSFSAPASVRNQVMVMNPLRIGRAEGELAGRTEQDFAARTIDLDIVSSVDPKAVARMLGPKAEEIMRLYRVEGPTRMVARGLVDYRTNLLTDIALSVTGQHFGIKWFVADTCAFDLHMQGSTLRIRDLAGSLCSGDLSGSAEFSGIGRGPDVAYTVEGSFTNLNLAEVVTNLRQVERDPYTGRLSGAVVVSGLIGEGRGHTARGRGHVNIQDGRLFRVPLLGGLSTMLGKITPGLGHATQTDLGASFEIKDGGVHSDNIVLGGEVIRLLSRGVYSFNEELEFDVKVRPRGEGPLSDVITAITSPLTFLLEFHLDGTLREPEWRPENLPKELFFILD